MIVYLLLAVLYFGGLLTLIAVDPAHIRESERARLQKGESHVGH